MSRPLTTSRGPFRADQIRPGDPYELSNGHAVHCMGTGGRGSRANLLGGSVLDSDPGVEEAGVDTGYSPSPDTLRAPDVAVGNVPDAPGWVEGAPLLAVEYADTGSWAPLRGDGQDEKELETKISELFAAGTKLVWVVRLVGPRRVEVYESGKEKRLVHPGEDLVAPGTLRNPVPVEALYDRRAAHEVTLRNLLQRQGYRDLEQVRGEGREQGREETLRAAVVAVLKARGFTVDDAIHAALDACRDSQTLQLWLTRAATTRTPAQVFIQAGSPER
ncbi:MAG: Uma2 family endonuclease [Thermoanaerobaculia bacterium]